MTFNQGVTHPALLQNFGNRERTTTSSSTISNSSTAPLLPTPAFTSFYFGQIRRRLVLLLTLLLACLLFLASLKRYTTGDIFTSAYFGSITASRTSQEEPLVLEPQPLTELGFEADYVYENIGSTIRSDYLEDLENFLWRSFPALDNDENDPDSLVSLLHTFVPPTPRAMIIHPQQAFRHLIFLPFRWVYIKMNSLWKEPEAPPPPLQPTIPNRIYQTGPYPGKAPPNDKILPLTWQKGNPLYNYSYFDNEAALEFINKRFNESHVNKGRGGGVAATYTSMRDVPVMQSDFWRYAVLASEGGVYSEFVNRPGNMHLLTVGRTHLQLISTQSVSRLLMVGIGLLGSAILAYLRMSHVRSLPLSSASKSMSDPDQIGMRGGLDRLV